MIKPLTITPLCAEIEDMPEIVNALYLPTGGYESAENGKDVYHRYEHDPEEWFTLSDHLRWAATYLRTAGMLRSERDEEAPGRVWWQLTPAGEQWAENARNGEKA